MDFRDDRFAIAQLVGVHASVSPIGAACVVILLLPLFLVFALVTGLVTLVDNAAEAACPTRRKRCRWCCWLAFHSRDDRAIAFHAAVLEGDVDGIHVLLFHDDAAITPAMVADGTVATWLASPVRERFSSDAEWRVARRETLRTLLQHPDMTAPFVRPSLALQHIADIPDLSMWKWLVAHGAPVDSHRVSAVLSACKRHLGSLESYLPRCEPLPPQQAHNVVGSPLYHAVLNANGAAVEWLLARDDVDPNAPSAAHLPLRRPLEVACSYVFHRQSAAHLPCLAALLRHPRIDMGITHQNMWTHLQWMLSTISEPQVVAAATADMVPQIDWPVLPQAAARRQVSKRREARQWDVPQAAFPPPPPHPARTHVPADVDPPSVRPPSSPECKSAQRLWHRSSHHQQPSSRRGAAGPPAHGCARRGQPRLQRAIRTGETEAHSAQ
jgi:hypothetical protein